ncbi:COG1361 S-layer family protein [Halopiger xanaduensis]|nr:CARDB domain-containing protein [Halopiger xanaduensis]
MGLPTMVSAAEVGKPNLSVYAPDNEVQPGTENSINLKIKNDAELKAGSNSQMLTANGVTVELEDTGPFEVKSGETPVGPIQDGQMVEVPQRIEVPDDVEPGKYEVTVRVRYSHWNRISSMERKTETKKYDVTLVVPDEPRFDVDTVKSDVEPGASGEAMLEITNTGTERANETRATIAGGTGITVDGATAEAPAEEAIGDLEPGESTTTTVDVTLAESLSAGEKPIEVGFTYRDTAGIEREAPAEITTLTPGPEQTFSIDTLEDTLSVGYEGEITGEIANDGPRPIDDAVLIVEPMSESLYIEDTRYALPALEAGETATFRYPTDVSGQADPGPRQLRFSVEYTGPSGEATLSDGPMSERVVVDERQDEFSITDDGVTVQQGKTSEFALTITNEREQTLSNIDARLYADSPLSTNNDEAFVPELEPGESTKITFDVSAESAAATETHPVELDFEYETESGESKLSDVYQHPIDVVPAESDGGGGGFMGSLVTVMIGLTIAGLGGVAWWRRT